MRTKLFAALLLLGLPCHRGASEEKKPAAYPEMAPVDSYLIPDAQAEIALARSAAPPSISNHAEVLVLSKSGYGVAVKGTNGFTCFVERSWAANFDEPQFWNPKLRSPNCFNPQAVRSVLPQYLKRTSWVLSGAGKDQVVERTRAAVLAHEFGAPEAGSVSFMLSKQGYVSDDADGPWMPHVMFFIPHGQAATWAAGLEGSPILGQEGSALEQTVLFVPVRAWSDGTPGPAAGHAM
jgi:hypothetical protein